MRSVAQFEAKVEAERFGAVLFAQGIENRVDKGRDGKHTVWVFDEEQMEAAQQAFDLYREAPNDPRINKALKQAEARQKQVKAASKKAEKRSGRPRPVHRGVAPLTSVLITTCVVIYILIEGFELQQLRSALLYAKRPGLAMSLGLAPLEAVDGQYWRLFTPALMHASVAGPMGWLGILHIVFNMMWLKDLGTIFERFHSTWLLALVVLLSAVISNTLQFVMVGPLFVGMSGVVYALFGYLWFRGKFDPWAGYRLPQQLVVWMLVWFAFGWFGNFIANWAHAGGLIVGAILGFLGSLGRKPPGAA